MVVGYGSCLRAVQLGDGRGFEAYYGVEQLVH